MEWKRLKSLNCPKCNRVLERNAKDSGYKCACGFFITNAKFEAILKKMLDISNRRPRISKEETIKRLEELNNL